MTGASITTLDLNTESKWDEPTFPAPGTDFQKVVAALRDLDNPAHRKWVPGPTRPIEVVEVSSLAQLPIILHKLQASSDTVRLVFPEIATGDAAKDTKIAEEQKEIHDFIANRHAKPVGALILEAFSLVGNSHIFDEVKAQPEDFKKLLTWWLDNDNKWKLNAHSKTELQVAHVVDLSTGADDAEQTALCDMLIKGVINPPNGVRFVCILPAVEDEARALGQKALEAVRDASKGQQVDLTSTKVWVAPSVVWDGATIPAKPPCVTQMSLEELRRRLAEDEEIVNGLNADVPPPRRGWFGGRALKWILQKG